MDFESISGALHTSLKGSVPTSPWLGNWAGVAELGALVERAPAAEVKRTGLALA